MERRLKTTSLLWPYSFKPNVETIESFYYFEDPVNGTTSLLRPGFYGPTVVALTGFHCIIRKCTYVYVRFVFFFLLCTLRTPWANFSAAFPERVLQCSSLVITLRYSWRYPLKIAWLVIDACPLLVVFLLCPLASSDNNPLRNQFQHHISTHSYIEIHFVWC